MSDSRRNRLRGPGILVGSSIKLYDVWWRPKRRKPRIISVTTDTALWSEIGRTKLESLVREEFCDQVRAIGSRLEVTDRSGTVVLAWKW